MRFKIEGKVKGEIQFVSKDFLDEEAAEVYAKKYCKNWKDLKITKLK